MSALFNFQSLLLVILLIICTCTYLRATAPSLIDRNKNGSVLLCLSTFSHSIYSLSLSLKKEKQTDSGFFRCVLIFNGVYWVSEKKIQGFLGCFGSSQGSVSRLGCPQAEEK
ncbi:hypothetical protein PGTUg99_004682 [Puccinia graminis f. sp. tritici]|uniref:Protein kish n=1 Tax=Puccinia graminis f. sp. tritici TaxID=56615 RepID=A0A5B0MAH2_PUCGR|nr:hypothetical protein PGTUg99_004682 [Puccinia graminis f. sp. tritici]